MSKRFTTLSIVFCVCLIAANLFETKIFSAGALTLTGGFLVFPISYILNDVISEVYGYRRMRYVIFTAFGVNAAFVLLAQIVKILPGADYYNGQQHFEYIFDANFRITLASMLAFVCGSLLNAKVLSRLKSRNNRGGFSVRAIVSTLIGESADSLVFFPIAFHGIGQRNIIVLMVTQILLKTLYEIIVLPLTKRVVKHVSDKESL